MGQKSENTTKDFGAVKTSGRIDRRTGAKYAVSIVNYANVSTAVKSRNWYTDSTYYSSLKNKTKGRIRGSLTPLPYTYRYEEKRGMTGHWQFNSYDSSQDASFTSGYNDADLGAYGTFLGYTQAEIDSIDARARTKLRLDLKDQKVNLWQAYAERAQTADLLASTAKALASCVTNLKKGNIVAAAQAVGLATVSKRKRQKFKREFAQNQAKAIGSGVLALRYGWQPLLNDVYGSAQLLAQKNVRELRSRAAASVTMVKEDVETAIFNNNGMKRTSTRKSKRTIKYTVYFSTAEEVHTLSQIGLTNPALIAWELLPWSFVFDWFIPIGNYISSWDATLGLTFEKGVKTDFREYTVKDIHSSTNGGVGGWYSGYSDSSYFGRFINRSQLLAFPGIAMPQWKNPFSTEHVQNAMALLTQVRRIRF